MIVYHHTTRDRAELVALRSSLSTRCVYLADSLEYIRLRHTIDVMRYRNHLKNL